MLAFAPAEQAAQAGNEFAEELLALLVFAEFALAFKFAFALDHWPGSSLAFQGRARRGKCDTPQGLRSAPAIGHGGQMIEERLMLGFLLVLQLEFVSEFVR